MKTILFFILTITVSTAWAVDQKERKSDMQYYQITNQKKDQSIPKGKARIAFTFKEHSGICLRNQVKCKHNNQKIYAPQLDSNGYCMNYIKPGNYKFTFWTSFCDTLVTDEIKITNQLSIEMLVHLHSNEMMIEADKPVIYLYNQNATTVNLTLDFKEKIKFAYPALVDNAWNVQTSANGTIQLANNAYNYLFWEGEMNLNDIKTNYSQGSIVETSNLVNFLEKSLANIGLNSKETADFITYWVPRMMVNEKNYIHFMLTNEYENNIATLKVNPKPDTQLRVYMLWSKIDDQNTMPTTVPQVFPPFERKPFTLIEWGGSEIKNLFNHL